MDFYENASPDSVVEYLRANHSMIHYFGLGFIQLKLNDRERMHFYIPGLEPIVPEEDVHNHRYDFQSTILRGRLTQELWSPHRSAEGTHVIEEVTCEEGVAAERTPGIFILEMDSSHTYVEGSSYMVSHRQFHKVRPGSEGCITLIERSGYKKNLAQVVKPIDGDSICPFSRKIPEDELWGLVRKALS
jgi:hypothetical protein